MKKLLIVVSLLFYSLSYACNGIVIGFKGKDNVFDHKAFKEYVTNKGYCGRTYSWNQIDNAIKQINSTTVPYQLYGYSKGAETVSVLLKKTAVRRPEYVLTIGAYRTIDVNFDKYNVKYNNYFDDSGKGQTSPGMFLNVSHYKIQQEVNKIIWGQ